MKNLPDHGQMKLRLPLALKTWLQAQALEAHRSLTAEITFRLEASRQADQRPATTKEQP